MNQKKAKKLRKLAKKATIGMPETHYVLAGGTEMGGVRRVRHPRIEHSLRSTRGTYRWLKEKAFSASTTATRSSSK